jgi:hypothetical protein
MLLACVLAATGPIKQGARLTLAVYVALSLKQGCEIIHYLIERLVDDSVSFKDSALAFDSLRDLIVYYCLDRVGKPTAMVQGFGGWSRLLTLWYRATLLAQPHRL